MTSAFESAEVGEPIVGEIRKNLAKKSRQDPIPFRWFDFFDGDIG